MEKYNYGLDENLKMVLFLMEYFPASDGKIRAV
jgi:hypothetical protein